MRYFVTENVRYLYGVTHIYSPHRVFGAFFPAQPHAHAAFFAYFLEDSLPYFEFDGVCPVGYYGVKIGQVTAFYLYRLSGVQPF